MDLVLIFFPVDIKSTASGYLCGFYKESQNGKCKSVYIFGSESVEYRQDSSCKTHNVIGFFTNNIETSLGYRLKSVSDDAWICVNYSGREVTVENCSIRKKPHPLEKCILVLYNSCSFNKSEMLLQPTSLFDIDHFRIISENLISRSPERTNTRFRYTNNFIINILTIFCYIHGVLSRYSILSNYSASALQLSKYAHSMVWVLNSLKIPGTSKLKFRNYITAVGLDILAGFMVYFTVTGWKNADEIFTSLTYYAECVIDSIANLVKWLMVTPAGLKLNEPLANLLGSLVFYYLDIWRNFLYLVRPLLELFFLALIKLGFLGLTFQLAMLTDIFAVMSFHVYCIYIYASRLYEIQRKGVHSLSRLVLGRKRNPEPGRVDSCPYSTEELLIGTISFAVLLFLLPTTLVFYVVFTGLRLGVLLTRGLMTWTIYFIQTLPVYSSFIWFFSPSDTATRVKLTPLKSNSIHGVLEATLTKASWFETVCQSIPDAVPPPSSRQSLLSNLASTLSNVVIGKLI